MTDLSKFTNAEIAALTYAMEQFHDEVRKSSESTKALIKAAEKLRIKFSGEYAKRKLHWEKFYNG